MESAHTDILKQAVMQQRSGDLASAEASYTQFLKLEPNQVDAHCNLSYLYLQKGDLPSAKKSVNQAIAINPEHGVADNLLGIIASKEGKDQNAVECFMKAIEKGAANKETFDGLGISAFKLGDYILAAKSWRSYLQLEPFSGRALSMLMDCIQHSAEWSSLPELELKLRNFVDAREGNMPFYPLLYSELNEIQMKAAAMSHSHYLRAIHGNFTPPEKGKHTQGQKIKVGYFTSADKDSLVGIISKDLYKNHDNDEFEIFVYGVEAPDGIKHFCNIADLSDEEAAEKIRADDLDILIDMDGYRKNNRQRVLLRRPCGVIINYLGHGGTMGSDYHNYIITDKFLLGEKEHVTETPIYVTCASGHNRSAVKPDGSSRVDHRLLEDSIVLGYFGSIAKITPGVMSIWLRIMQKFPKAQLWLLGENDVFKRNIIDLAKLYNIAEARIVFAERVSHQAHLGRLSHVDLLLDSFPHGSLGSCLDGLQMGIPFVSCAGRIIQSRYGVSVLAQVGMLDFFARNVKEYIEKICMLIQDEDRLRGLRERISEKALESSVFDGVKFVGELEEYYRRIVAMRE